MEIIKQCPVCGEGNFTPKLQCTDYTVSGDVFQIVECNGCQFLFTNPRPEESALSRYYQSAEYISHSDTSRGLINKLYKIIRGITLKKKFNLIRPYLKNNKLLDIGCGTGAFLSYCKNENIITAGVEPDDGAKKIAREKYSLQVEGEDSLNTFPDGSFSVITMWHVLEHVPRLNERVAEIRRILHPEGKLIVAVPNYLSDDAKRYGAFWAAYDVPRHLYHFTPSTIKRLFEKHGMVVEKVLPMYFDAFYVSLLSQKNKSGKMNYLKAFLHGFVSNWRGLPDKYSSQIYILSK